MVGLGVLRLDAEREELLFGRAGDLVVAPGGEDETVEFLSDVKPHSP
jgi:hypothetical protein